MKKQTKIKINKNSNIAEIVFNYPETIEVFGAFGLHCSTCFASQFDTIEQGAKVHDMMDEEIEELVDELNKVINKEDEYGSAE